MYHYVVIRADLPPGFASGQIVHAAGETAVGGPVPVGTHAVVLEVEDEAHLLRISAKLANRGVPRHLVREPDAPFCGAATALGIPPGPRRRELSGLPLYAPERRTR